MAMPAGNGTTRHSRTVSHGGHARAATGSPAAGSPRAGGPAAARGSWWGGCRPCTGIAQMPGKLALGSLAVTAWACRDSSSWSEVVQAPRTREGEGTLWAMTPLGTTALSPGTRRPTALGRGAAQSFMPGLGCQQCAALPCRSRTLSQRKAASSSSSSPGFHLHRALCSEQSWKERAQPGAAPPSPGAGRGWQQPGPHQQPLPAPPRLLLEVAAPLIPPPTAPLALLAHPARRNPTFRGAGPSRAGPKRAGRRRRELP